MKGYFTKFIALLCVVALMPTAAFGETTQNDTEEQEAKVDTTYIVDYGTDDEAKSCREYIYEL